MPELPEVEHLRRSLTPRLLGATVREARLCRADVLRIVNGDPRAAMHRMTTTRGAGERYLLRGQRIDTIRRHGKQLAIIGENGAVLCIHLGMSGQMRFIANGQRLAEPDSRHVHARWRIDGPTGRGRLIFRDPRRFGGLWAFASVDELQQHRWSALGPDALTVTTAQLRTALARAQRPVKAALLDQHVIAGVGNIYADEALFAARVHPLWTASAVPGPGVTALARALRLVLRRAIAAGGSTIGSYTDADGSPGRYALRHQVYGRGGRACRRCGCVLDAMLLAGRTTIACPACQPLQFCKAATAV